MPKIRSKENKEMVEDFIESGERLTDKLRKLLKLCETPMLKLQRKRETQLGNNAGVEFVDTLYGRERELERTEKFMQSVRLWNLRFDANCEEILESLTCEGPRHSSHCPSPCPFPLLFGTTAQQQQQQPPPLRGATK